MRVPAGARGAGDRRRLPDCGRLYARVRNGARDRYVSVGMAKLDQNEQCLFSRVLGDLALVCVRVCVYVCVSVCVCACVRFLFCFGFL